MSSGLGANHSSFPFFAKFILLIPTLAFIANVVSFA